MLTNIGNDISNIADIASIGNIDTKSLVITDIKILNHNV